MSADLQNRFAQVRLLALDSDGVLTDGGVFVAEDGSQFRRFDIKDGLGLKLVMQAGVRVAIISSATCVSVQQRARQLGIEDVFIGIYDKLTALQQLCTRHNINLSQVAYMGDDLPDVPILQAVGLPCAPADAVFAVKSVAIWVSAAQGGKGAVRELCDWIVQMRSIPTS